MSLAADTMRAAYASSGYPLAAHLDLTFDCPMDCIHCLHQTKAIPSNPLGLQQWTSVLHQLFEMKTLILTFSGGEILTLPWLPYLLKVAHRLGFVVNLKTSGWGATPALTASIAASGVHRVDVSIYGSSGEAHDQVTRVRGSFNNTLSFAAALRNQGVATRAVLTPVGHFFDDVAVFAPRLVQMGFKSVALNWYSPSDCAAECAKDLMPSPEVDRTMARPWPADGSGRPPPVELKGHVCGAGLSVLYVSPFGTVHPCVRLGRTSGKVQERPLVELWHSLARVREEYNPLVSSLRDCRDCRLGAVRAFCPAVAQAVARDPTRCVDELARICRAHDPAVPGGRPLE